MPGSFQCYETLSKTIREILRVCVFLLGPERVESKVMSWAGDGAQGLRSCLATRFQPSTTRGKSNE